MPFTRVLALLIAVIAGFSAAAQEQKLLRLAEERGSDALYVTVDGKPLIDWTRGERRPIELMSAVKSLVAIAVGRLLQDGQLKSLDEPVHTFYPEWKQGRKKAITVRHLLNHTSGLQNVPNAGAEIYPAPNAIRLALAAELAADPGAEFSYNNKAVNLLAGVIERASGLRMDLYFQEKLFAPLGITQYQWYFDKSGHPHAMAGLRLLAADAARFGELVLNRGMHGATRLIPEAYAAELVAPGQQHNPLAGLLWWRYAPNQQIAMKAALPRIDDAGLRAKLERLRATQFTSRRELRQALHRELGDGYEPALVKVLGSDWFNALFDWKTGDVVAWYAEGSLGQYIVVVPEAKLVAVRQLASRSGLNEQTNFHDFPAEVYAFARGLR